MKLVPVEAVPYTNGHRRHDLQALIEEFVESDARIVKIELDELDYKSPSVCRSCINVAIKRSKRGIKVFLRGNMVFLSKD